MLGDLLTLRQLKLPIKIVVFNNSSLAFVELEMKAAGIVNYGTDLDNPNFADLAKATGLHGVRVEYPNDLEVRAAYRLRDSRSCPRRSHRQPAGALHAAFDHLRAGQRLLPLGSEVRSQRSRRRSPRPRQDQRAAANPVVDQSIQSTKACGHQADVRHSERSEESQYFVSLAISAPGQTKSTFFASFIGLSGHRPGASALVHCSVKPPAAASAVPSPDTYSESGESP